MHRALHGLLVDTILEIAITAGGILVPNKYETAIAASILSALYGCLIKFRT